MLILSRKKNETVRITEEITIVIVEIRGDKVRLGIEAPQRVAVHRGEVWDKIEQKNPGQPVPAHGDQSSKGAKMATGTPAGMPGLKGGK